MSTLGARAAALADRACERAEAIERDRRLPDDLVADMAEAGLFRMLVPRCYGGLEVHPSVLVDVLVTLARGDGATGWCAMIGATTGMLAASLPAEHAEVLYGRDPAAVTCGVTAPFGRARPVEGGWQVSGRWPFASASAHARWICGGSLIVDEAGEPAGPEGAPPQVHLMFFPAESVQRIDNWHVSGLCGTGSGDIEVEDVFVPAGRSVVLGTRPQVDAPLYRFPTLGLLALGVGSVALGIGYRALDELVALAGGKVPTGARRPLARRGAVQADVARARGTLTAARSFVDKAIAEAWARAEQGERLDAETKAELRLAATHATWAAVDAVDRTYHAAGGTAVYADSPLQRCLRDVHVASQHAMVAQPVLEPIGRVVLGMEAGTPL